MNLPRHHNPHHSEIIKKGNVFRKFEQQVKSQSRKISVKAISFRCFDFEIYYNVIIFMSKIFLLKRSNHDHHMFQTSLELID